MNTRREKLAMDNINKPKLIIIIGSALTKLEPISNTNPLSMDFSAFANAGVAQIKLSTSSDSAIIFFIFLPQMLKPYLVVMVFALRYVSKETLLV